MRKPPIPRAVPHRLQRERWAAVGACGVLVLGHAARAVVDAHHLAYLSVLDVLAIAAALGAGAQLVLVDDAISWYSAVGLASLVAAASFVSLTVGSRSGERRMNDCEQRDNCGQRGRKYLGHHKLPSWKVKQGEGSVVGGKNRMVKVVNC